MFFKPENSRVELNVLVSLLVLHNFIEILQRSLLTIHCVVEVKISLL